MSMFGGRFPQSPDDLGQTVASFSSYERAQKAVSSLIAADVPARQIAIVGTGLRSVERVTGRLGYATAARSGAINGLLLGLLFSAILVIGSPSVPIQAFVGVLFVGIAIGMLLSLVTFAFVRRRRDYASITQVIADHYEVTVAAANAMRARQVLGPQAPEPAARPRVVADSAPPAYGERVPDVDATAKDSASPPQIPDAAQVGEDVQNPDDDTASAPREDGR
ncbi:general stress protein [Microbacterium koreense]|uniref:General stress protein n=1 Tax=Microbacterium koreense TaxID=323761 RepID=A0ABW2ZRA0_9MICO